MAAEQYNPQAMGLWNPNIYPPYWCEKCNRNAEQDHSHVIKKTATGRIADALERIAEALERDNQ